MQKKQKGMGRKKLFAVIGSLAVTLAVTLGVTVSVATGAEDSYEEEIRKAEAEYDQALAKYNSLLASLEELKAEYEDITEYLTELDEKSGRIYKEIGVIQNEINVIEKELELENEELEKVTALANEQYDTMKKRVKYMYENGEGSMLEIIQGADNLGDILNQVEYRRKISEYDSRLLKKYQTTMKQKDELVRLIDAKLKKFNAAKESQESALLALQQFSDSKAQRLAAVCAELGIDEDLLTDYDDEVLMAGANVAFFKALEQDRLDAEERERSRIEELKKSTKLEDMMWPFPTSRKITSPFGYRGDIGVEGATEYHSGIDISGLGLYGEDGIIYAALAGTVEVARYSLTAGNYIKINHGNGVYTIYMHGSELFVSKGEKVERGQAIMQVGSTGISSGPHLHFEISINDVRVDPLEYVKQPDKKK